MLLRRASSCVAIATWVSPRDVVRSRCFEGYYHEIFNETDPEPVFAELKQWLDLRFPG